MFAHQVLENGRTGGSENLIEPALSTAMLGFL